MPYLGRSGPSPVPDGAAPTREHLGDGAETSTGDPFRVAAGLAGLGVFEIDEAQATAYWSPVLRDIFGVEPTALVTFDEMLGFVHPDDREGVVNGFHEALDPAGDGRHRATYRVVRPDGGVRWVVAQSQTTFGADGAIVRTIGAVQDVTELRQARFAAERAERMAALGQLAAGVSHEFKNLLWGIDLHAGFILGADGAPEAVHQDAAMIRDVVSRGMTVSRQLMDFARPRAPTGVVELREAILSLEPLLERLLGEGRALVLDLAGTSDRARIDQGQVEQILINLVMNARDVVPAGGTVTIATSTTTLDADASAQLEVAPGAYQVLLVSDTGSGIEPGTLERVFDPYFTTKDAGQGTGLGLATTLGVVRAAGGSIRAESEPGAGATFRILIPTARDTPGGAAS